MTAILNADTRVSKFTAIGLAFFVPNPCTTVAAQPQARDNVWRDHVVNTIFCTCQAAFYQAIAVDTSYGRRRIVYISRCCHEGSCHNSHSQIDTILQSQNTHLPFVTRQPKQTQYSPVSRTDSPSSLARRLQATQPYTHPPNTHHTDTSPCPLPTQ